MRPLVSTLICTFNAESFIIPTIESVRSQTYDNQEILIFDDGSGDRTLEMLRGFSLKDSRIKIYSVPEKLGSYGGLNYLLERANGKYIAIQDHDDIWHPEKLHIQVKYLEKNSKMVGSGTSTLMYYGKSKMGFLCDTRERDVTKVIHTSLMFRNDGYRYDRSIDFLADGYFMECILTKGLPLLHVHPEALTLHYYKETGGNYSEQRFKVTPANIRRYFRVYKWSLYFFLLFCYLMFTKLITQKIKAKIDKFIIIKIKKAQTYAFLSHQKYTRELLQYY